MSDIKKLRQVLLTIRSHLEDLLERIEPKAEKEELSTLQHSCSWLDYHLGIIEKEVLTGREKWHLGPDMLISLEIAQSYINEGCDPKLAYARVDPVYNIIYKATDIAKRNGAGFESDALFELSKV